MNQAPIHLTDAQIQDLVLDSANGPGTKERLESHVADCESCLVRLLEAERIRLALLEGDGMKKTPYPHCPAEETLQELAAGVCAPGVAQTATEHASQCDHCGPLLKRYLEEFSDELPAEDAAFLTQLETSQSKWQKKFIRENFLQRGKKPGFVFWPKLATAGAVLSIVAIAGIYLSRSGPDDLNRAQSLVASAYSERRTIEMRLTGVPYAQYSPLPVERSAEADSALVFQRPSLLRAGAAVGDKLQAGSHLDPRWLQVKGRIDLLESTAASAAEAQGVLEKARSEGLNNPSLDIDLAASSFEHARRTENPDLSETINFLRAALDDPKISKPDQLVALFDLGIAYQKSKMPDLAIEAWERYLQLDPSSNWASEARERLEAAKKAASAFRNQSSLDGQSPFFF